MRQNTYIYFVAPVGGGLIKIGKSDKPEARCKLLNHSSPVQLEILAVAAGRPHDEFKIQEALFAHRVRFDWFEPCEEILGLIEEIKVTGEVPERLRARPGQSNPMWKNALGYGYAAAEPARAA